MKVLFIITSSDKGTWLSEVTHPYWHLAERGFESGRREHSAHSTNSIPSKAISQPHASASARSAESATSNGLVLLM